MIYLDSEDRIIRQAFPTYDRSKSKVADYMGSEYNGYIVAEIYHKGMYLLKTERGKLVSKERVKV